MKQHSVMWSPARSQAGGALAVPEFFCLAYELLKLNQELQRASSVSSASLILQTSLRTTCYLTVQFEEKQCSIMHDVKGIRPEVLLAVATVPYWDQLANTNFCASSTKLIYSKPLDMKDGFRHCQCL